MRPPVVAREVPPPSRARWRFRLVALLLPALLGAAGVQLFRVLSGATALAAGIGAASALLPGRQAGPGGLTAN